MPLSFKALLPFAFLILASACNQRAGSPAAKKGSEQESVAQDLDKFEAGVRIAAANKRIDELERKIGELETTPDKLNLDLLTRRVTALEVKANDPFAAISDPAPAKTSPNSGQLKTDTAQLGATRRSTTRSTVLKLPNLEKGPRLATPAEAEAFSPGK
jgi:hypothetical protein